VKRLFSSEKIEFDKEVTILKALGSKKEKHPHLITLLATFKHKKKYHLVFPYANANLRKYWEDRPFPSFDEVTVLWSLNQMTGIANALELVHNFERYPLSVDGRVRWHKFAKLRVQTSEELFGRHGDIKPENILWFQKTPEIEDERGILQLADFGLGRFHGRDSRSKVPWNQIVGGSPTYEPPECKLHRPVSRTYDIWSLGCLYLEFITWLLKGSAEITGFSIARRKTDPSTGSNDDGFFTIINDKDAVVRKEVIVWVQQLHEHENCSLLIHDLLDLIMGEVLLPNSKMRIPAMWLHHRLSECLHRATADKDYLLKPSPGQPQLSSDQCSQSGSPVFNTPKTKRKSVAFMNQAIPGNSLLAHSDSPRDLLGRGVATPGFLKRSKTDGIWPPPVPVNG
jgi:serine/threonine protein kinase